MRIDMGQTFGGSWTEEKLELLTKYLKAYLTIFTSNPRARLLHTVYVDAFAGAGYIRRRQRDTTQNDLFEDLIADDAQEFIKGSAVRALELNPGFGEYLFLERDPERFRELETLKKKYPGKQISVQNVEANEYLRTWCGRTNWTRTRAVIFLDPYGMQVDWSLVEAIARTKGVDLWLLFPLGAALMRLLQKRQPPPQGWADRVTAVLGVDTWQEEFYKPKRSDTLFGTEESEEREADYQSVSDFFMRRLKGIFEQVAPNPRVLKNSRNCPLYLFCFAAGNPKGAPTAVKIAQDILRGL
jgi:three-Cys-motif partner protein